MKHKPFLIFLSLIIFSTFTYANSGSYLCVTEESTGFYFENGKWGHAFFNVGDEKYILRELKEDEFGYSKNSENTYGLFPLGRDVPEYWCKKSNPSNIFSCRVGPGNFFFTPSTGRFIKTYILGYWNGEDNNNDTPNISRGRCSKI